MIRCLRYLVSVKLQLLDTSKKRVWGHSHIKRALYYFLITLDKKGEFVPSFTQWLSLLTNVRLTYKHLKRALRVGFGVHHTSVWVCVPFITDIYFFCSFSHQNSLTNMIVFGRRQRYVNGSSEWVKNRTNRFVNELQSQALNKLQSFKYYNTGELLLEGVLTKRKENENILSRFLTNKNTSFMQPSQKLFETLLEY